MRLSERKKILVFIDWYVPGFKGGGPIRSVKNLVDHLKSKADFFVVTRNTDYHTLTPYSDVESNTWNRIEDHVQVFYASRGNISAANWREILKQESWDHIYINGMFSWYFSLLPLLLMRDSNMNVILAPRGMLAPGALGVKSLKKKIFLHLAKVIGIFDKVTFHATHPGEADEIKMHISKDAKVMVIPNLAAIKSQSAWLERVKSRGEIYMISIARISPEKNTLYALEVLQYVLPSVKVVFHLYGPVNDMAYWQECQNQIELLPKHISVKYKGSIPNEQVSGALANYHLLFMPSRGENFGHVILEALTTGAPVLLSDRTPWRSLEEKKIGWDLPLNDFKNFAEVITTVAQSTQAEYNIISKAAYDYAKCKREDSDAINNYLRLFNL
jgi:glycosyltransferase involved in cell wall biosynthesis